jgi:hypothetical protein
MTQTNNTPQSPTDYRITPDETWVIKAFAIIAMFVHHLFFEHPEFGSAIFNISATCKICVTLFIFLSGYGMAASFPGNGSGIFCLVKIAPFVLCKRYSKFFLNYWFVFFVFVPIGIFCFGRPLEAAYGKSANLLNSFINDIFGLQSLNSYNATWWFNAIILTLWMLFPFLYLAEKNKIISVCLLIFLFLESSAVVQFFCFSAFGLERYIFPFALGIFIAMHSDGINKILNVVRPYIVFYMSLIIALFLLFLRAIPVFPNFTEFSVEPFATVFIVLAVVSLCRITKFRFASMQFIGKHSMNMYLTHTFIFGYFFHDFIYGFKYPILIFLVLFAASLLLSICIEFVKRRVGFYKLQGFVVDTINRVGGLLPKEHDDAY